MMGGMRMPDTHITKNYFTDNGDELVIGGRLTFTGKGKMAGTAVMPNQANDSTGTTASLKTNINALLTKLKDAGLMEGDPFTISVTKDVNDTVAGHADRQYNTGKARRIAPQVIP